MIRDSRFHGRRDPQRSMELAEVVVSEVQRYRRSVVLGLFAEAIRELVSLRICIRMVRFWRSTWLVQIFVGSGFPLITTGIADTASAGEQRSLPSRGLA